MSYEGSTVDQLRRLASSRKISGRAEMNRQELIAAHQAFDEKQDIQVRISNLERRVDALEAHHG